jgi:hypothetical protein
LTSAGRGTCKEQDGDAFRFRSWAAKSPAALPFVQAAAVEEATVEPVSTIIEGRAKWKARHFENGLPIRDAVSISTNSIGMKVPSW